MNDYHIHLLVIVEANFVVGRCYRFGYAKQFTQVRQCVLGRSKVKFSALYIAICLNCGRKILDIAGGVYLELVLIRPIDNPIFSNLPEWFITNGQVN